MLNDSVQRGRWFLCLLFSSALYTLVSPATSPNVVLGTIGDSVSIQCNWPISDTLVWEHSDGNIIAIHGHLTDRNSSKYAIERQEGLRESLIIHNLTLHDNTSFCCYDLVTRETKDFTSVNVLVEPFSFNMTSPPYDYINEGSEVTLTCESDGGKPLPDTRWFLKDMNGTVTEMTGRLIDVQYENGTGRRLNVLTFTATRDMYRSQLSCQMSVSVLYSRSLTVDLNVKLLPLPPVISGFTGNFDDNESVSMMCTSHASLPTANIYWWLDGRPAGDFEVVVIPEENGTLTVTSFFKRVLSRDNNGSVLTCAVTNDVLQDLGMVPLTRNVTMMVNYAPILIVSDLSLTATEGGNVTLSCVVDARPAARPDNVVWLHDGEVLSTERYTTGNRSDTTSLTIVNASRADAGLYICQASNRLGTTQSDPVPLQVHYTPKCVSDKITKYAAALGSSVRPRCHMTANPSDVTMTWQFQSTRRTIKTVGAETDDLERNHVFGSIELHVSDSRQYTTIECAGTNAVGTSTQPCLVQIVPPGEPDIPANCSVVTMDTGDVSIRCLPGFDGGSTQTFMLQRVDVAGFVPLENKSLPEFVLGQQFSSPNVTVRVCAVNTEFVEKLSCSSAITVLLNKTVAGREVPLIAVDEVDTAGIIAGVLAAVLFLLVLSGLLIYFRKKIKNQNTGSPFRFYPSLEGKTTRTVRGAGPVNEESGNHTPACERGHQVMNTFNSADIEQGPIQIVASTPYYALHHTVKTAALVNFASPDLSRFQASLPRKDSLHLTAIANIELSPIQKYRAAVSEAVSEVVQEVDVSLTRDDPTGSACYSAADIAAVLDGTEVAPPEMVLPKNIYDRTHSTKQTVAQGQESTFPHTRSHVHTKCPMKLTVSNLDREETLNSLLKKSFSLPYRYQKKGISFIEDSRLSETFERSSSFSGRYSSTGTSSSRHHSQGTSPESFQSVFSSDSSGRLFSSSSDVTFSFPTASVADWDEESPTLLLENQLQAGPQTDYASSDVADDGSKGAGSASTSTTTDAHSSGSNVPWFYTASVGGPVRNNSYIRAMDSFPVDSMSERNNGRDKCVCTGGAQLSCDETVLGATETVSVTEDIQQLVVACNHSYSTDVGICNSCFEDADRDIRKGDISKVSSTATAQELQIQTEKDKHVDVVAYF